MSSETLIKENISLPLGDKSLHRPTTPSDWLPQKHTLKTILNQFFSRTNLFPGLRPSRRLLDQQLLGLTVTCFLVP